MARVGLAVAGTVASLRSSHGHHVLRRRQSLLIRLEVLLVLLAVLLVGLLLLLSVGALLTRLLCLRLALLLQLEGTL